MNIKVILWIWLWGFYITPGYTAADSSTYRTLFIIDKLPASTPHDASVYLASDMDGWYPDISERKFTRNEHGKLQLLVTHTNDSIRFKVTRGRWKAVEGRENGRASPNRLFVAKKPYEEVHITVDSWEDISYPSYTVYMFFLLISAIQGVLLVVAINTLRNKNKRANSILSVLLVLITISLLGRASTFDPDVFNWQPKLLFIPELILFTYGPLFFFYIHKLLGIEIDRKWIWVHFIPATIQVALYAPYLPMHNQTFIYRVLDKEMFPYFAITGAIALVFNSMYWLLCKRLIINYGTQENLNEKQKKYVRFLQGVLHIKAVYLFLWLAVVGIYVTGRLLQHDLLYISENLIDVLWLLFSLIIFALAYYAVKHPEVLREKKKYQDHSLKQDEISVIMQRLKQLLEDEKVYLKPDLTLESLAHMIPTSTHTLSRIINQQYNQSFTDLINTYRVNEFIKKAEQSKQSAFLELAFSVGFNSKPTFNRAFKKVKGSTPREYFKKAKI